MKKRLSVLIFALLTMSLLPMAAAAEESTPDPQRVYCYFETVPSIDKGKYACQRVFPALFALFALAGASPPASQKPKITCKFIAGRCLAVLPEQKCAQTRKDPQVILPYCQGT